MQLVYAARKCSSQKKMHTKVLILLEEFSADFHIIGILAAMLLNIAKIIHHE